MGEKEAQIWRYKDLRVVIEVFKAYLRTELIRNSGFLFGLLSLILWLLLFLTSIILFSSEEVDASMVSSHSMVAMAIFLSYSIATWDWAWEIRRLGFHGIMDYVITSGRDFLVIFLGLIPVSLIWFSASLLGSYVLLSLLISPPLISVVDLPTMLVGSLSLLLVLLGYSMILGGVTISTGASGPVMEFLGWILPIATGGLTPLERMPHLVRSLALATPFSYPAEMIRYSLGLANPVLGIEKTIVLGITYSVSFFLLGIFFFKRQIRKILIKGTSIPSMY